MQLVYKVREEVMKNCPALPVRHVLNRKSSMVSDASVRDLDDPGEEDIKIKREILRAIICLYIEAKTPGPLSALRPLPSYAMHPFFLMSLPFEEWN